jgi:acyl carrier protein
MAQIVDMKERERQEYLETLLSKELADVLKLPVEKIEKTSPLMEQGIDSLMTVELKNRLSNVLGIAVPETLFFSYPTIEKVTQYFLNEIIQFENSEEDVIEDPEIQILKNFGKLLKHIDEGSAISA